MISAAPLSRYEEFDNIVVLSKLSLFASKFTFCEKKISTLITPWLLFSKLNCGHFCKLCATNEKMIKAAAYLVTFCGPFASRKDHDF